MAVVTPPTITALPAPPDPSNRATFNTLAYPWSVSQGVMATQLGAVATNVAANATDAANSAATAATQATIASGAAAASGVTVWVTSTTYAIGNARYSPANSATYRRITTGAGTVDPSLDATNWQPVLPGATGSGGTTATGNVTLTVSSPGALSVTPAAAGLYATLPDATTCAKSAVLFTMYNAGDFDYGIKNSAGTQLGWLKPRTGTTIGLADNTTAAGAWINDGLDKFGLTASVNFSTLSGASNGNSILPRLIALDANRACLVFGGTSLYAVAYDASSQIWGTPVLVRSGIKSNNQGFNAVLSATNQVLIISTDAATAMQAVTLTSAGTALTVNTAVNLTMAAAIGSFDIPSLIALTGGFVAQYHSSLPAAKIVAITVSGTVPAFGAEVTLPVVATLPLKLFAFGAVLRTVGFNDAGTSISATPYTLSGATLTAGTGATTAMTIYNSQILARCFVNTNGNIMLAYNNTNFFGAVIKLTGTTEAFSTVQLAGVASTKVDFLALTGNKLISFSHSDATSWACNILTDTSGVASAGTALTGIAAGVFSAAFSGLNVFSNVARFAAQTSAVSVITQFEFGCAGVSPTLSAVTILPNTTLQSPPYSLGFESLNLGRHIRTLTAGSLVYLLGTSDITNGLTFAPGAIRLHARQPIGTGSNTGVPDTSSSSWFMDTGGNATGVQIQRMEVSA